MTEYCKKDKCLLYETLGGNANLACDCGCHFKDDENIKYLESYKKSYPDKYKECIIDNKKIGGDK